MAATLRIKSSWLGAAGAAAPARGAGGTRGDAAGAAADGRGAGAWAASGAAAAGGAAASAGAGAPVTGGAAAAFTDAEGAAGFGILIVGAAVGFGGRLMRTVSFLGWTLALSDGFGGVAPAGGGTGGLFSGSDINLCRRR